MLLAVVVPQKELLKSLRVLVVMRALREMLPLVQALAEAEFVALSLVLHET
jgi:hypothetical protein